MRIDELMQFTHTNALEMTHIAELGDLISAIGGISKGFPDYNNTDKTSMKHRVWTDPFITTVKGILVVLAKFNNFSYIRESVLQINLDPVCSAENGWMHGARIVGTYPIVSVIWFAD